MAGPKKRLGKGKNRLKFEDVSPRAEKEEQEMLDKKMYGGKMKKKPVAMKAGGILGALDGGMPLMGIIPQMIHHNKKKKNKPLRYFLPGPDFTESSMSMTFSVLFKLLTVKIKQNAHMKEITPL